MLAWIALFGLFGCTSGSVDATVVDGLTGKPVSDVVVFAKATDEGASVTCKAFEGQVTDGKLKIEGLCGGGYALGTSDKSWWIESPEIADGAVAVNREIKMWRMPKSGVFVVKADGSLKALKTSAGIKTETVWAGTEKIQFPAGRLKNYPLLEPTDHLLIAGKSNIDKLSLKPLIHTGPRVFGTEKLKVSMEDWEYIGVEFTDDTTFKKVEAQIDESKVVNAGEGERVGRWIPVSAVAEGRYAMFGPKDLKMYLMDLGKAQPNFVK